MKKNSSAISLAYVLLLFCFSCNSATKTTGNNKDILSPEKLFKDLRKIKWHIEDSLTIKKENRGFKDNVLVEKAKVGESFTIQDSSDLKYVLDTLRLNKEYNDAMWRIYCFRCDKIVQSSERAKGKFKLPDSMTYGEMGLKPDDIWKINLSEKVDCINDTIDLRYQFCLYFSFTYQGIPCHIILEQHLLNDYGEDLYGMVYSKRFGAIPIYANSGGGILYYNLIYGRAKNKPSALKNVRMYNPLQPEVIYYVRTHAATIDKWFLNEAVNRGAFDTILYPQARIIELTKAYRRKKKAMIDN